jgi:hypothetical protein
MIKTYTKIKLALINYARKNNKSSFVIGVSGGINSSLLYKICNEITEFKTYGFHAIGASKIPDDVEKIELLSQNIEDRQIELASTLAKCAHKNNGIILGTVDKTRGHLVRDYYKYGDGSADLFPLLGLYKSDIANLLVMPKYTDYCELDPKGTANYHQNRLALTFEEIEWADAENEKSRVIELEPPPQETTIWYKYTLRQKEVLSRIHYLEKKTRHKKIFGRNIEI